MQNFDATDINHFTKLQAPHCDFDARYVFYYDETNNIKKLHQETGSLNVDFSGNFILGGLAYKGNVKPDLSNLFVGIGLQPNIKEVKFTHIANGKFTDCLKSRKLKMVFERILNADVYLHFSSLNFLYFSLVDIVDSAIEGSGFSSRIDFGLNRILKNLVYKICSNEFDKVRTIFYKYEYPNIAEDKVNLFVKEIVEICRPYLKKPDYKQGLEILIPLLETAANNKSLPFVMDDLSNVWINGLSAHYMRPIYIFVNATHHFDNETDIQKTLSEYKFIVDGEELKDYDFSDSQADIYTQASDVLVGFIGKFSKFANTHSTEQIEQNIRSLSPLQCENLDLYLDLILKSEDLNPGFFHAAESDDDREKFRLILQLRNKI